MDQRPRKTMWIPIEMADVKARLKTAGQRDSLLKEKPDFLETDIDTRKAEVMLAQFYTGHASTFPASEMFSFFLRSANCFLSERVPWKSFFAESIFPDTTRNSFKSLHSFIPSAYSTQCLPAMVASAKELV